LAEFVLGVLSEWVEAVDYFATPPPGGDGEQTVVSKEQG
jgi:hypothetical protein